MLANPWMICGTSLKLDTMAPDYMNNKFTHTLSCECHWTHIVLLSVKVLDCIIVRVLHHEIQKQTYCLVSEWHANPASVAF